VTMHIVGHFRTIKGDIYESTRERGVPQILQADRGSLVPGLDKALLTCREGDVCNVVVKAAGGYGNKGKVDANGVRTVPGDCTLVFELEIVKVQPEQELWVMSFKEKMRRAAEYRERGNVLFRNKYYDYADEEYNSAMRYLLFNTHPTEDELPFVTEGLVATQLNLCASKLRMGREKEAIKQAQDVMKMAENHPKALYRIGQANVQLGNYVEAERYLNKAITASVGDADAIKSCEKELERLARTRERHKRNRKKAFAKMIQPKRGRFDAVGEYFSDSNTRMMAAVGVATVAIFTYIFVV